MCAFRADWSESDPVDHSKFKTIPEKIRNLRVDISDRLSALLYGFIAGETDVGLKKANLKSQAADPDAVSPFGILYTKSVSAIIELFYRDTPGNIVQVTSGGKIRAESLGGVYPAANVAAIANILNLVYPVGSIYCNESVSTNPGTLFGVGTWLAIETRALVGYKSGDADFGTPGADVGAKTSSHSHAAGTLVAPCDVNIADVQQWNDTGYMAASYAGGGDATTASADKDLPIEGSTAAAAPSVIQPSRVVYMWKRTA